LSAYISLPLPTISSILPPELYMPSFLPTSNEEYMHRSHPIVSLHIVQFALETPTSRPYSCIGLTLPHGVVDGVGAAYLCRAIVSELSGEDWKVPPLPKEGFNANELQLALQSQEFAPKERPPEINYTRDAATKTPLIKNELRENVHRTGRIIVIPPNIYRSFVEDVRSDIEKSDIHNHVTTGDILVAWILKVSYPVDASNPLTLMVTIENV